MRFLARSCLLILACLLATGGIASSGGADWPHLRGPAGDGKITGTELFAGDEAGLALAWRIPLGPGYSGIAVADGTAVTLFSDGTQDVAVAVDAQTGKERWRYAFAETFKPRDGSDGGPLSTPLIHDGLVYGLGPEGQLFALQLATGEEVWKKDMSRDLGAVEPHFGFTSTPLMAGDMLILQAGGSDGRSIAGLNARTGEVAWSHGDGTVEYQSPALLQLNGRPQVVSVSSAGIHSFEPASGALLWHHPWGERDRADSAHLLAVEEDRFLTFVGGAATMFRVSGDESGSMQVEELYRSRSLGNTYALPVYHEGHLYGFSRQFLSCVDAETGKTVWKSRPPGGRGLILVDGHLVIYAAQGHVVVAPATPEGYREVARLKALDGSGYTWPSLAGDKVYVRNLSEMAAVSITSGPVGVLAQAGTVAAPGAGTAFAAMVARAEAAEDGQAVVDAYLAQQPSWPVVEGRFIHFLYQGEVQDLAIVGNMTATSQAETMQRVAGTDLHYRTYEVEPATKWEYRFIVDFDQPQVDPRNNLTAPASSDEVGWSLVVLEGAAVSPYVQEPADDRPRGTWEVLPFTAAGQKEEREIHVYLPAGYGQSEASYPLLVVHSLDWVEKGELANTLDNLVGDQVEPLVVAVVGLRRAWWLEGGGSETGKYADVLAGEIIPLLQEKYRLRDEASARGVMGASYYATTAFYAALKHPDVFGMVAGQSANLGLGSEEGVMAMVRAGQASKLKIFLGWNRWESRDPDSGVDVREDNLSLAQALEEHGGSVLGGEVMDAYGWSSWRNRMDDLLIALYPQP